MSVPILLAFTPLLWAGPGGARTSETPDAPAAIVQDADTPEPRVERGEEIPRPRRQGEDRRGEVEDVEHEEEAAGKGKGKGRDGSAGVPKNARAIANRMAADIRSHRQRVARIERLTELFRGKGKEEQLARTREVAAREEAAFAARMELYRAELGDETYDEVLRRLRQAPPKDRGKGGRGTGDRGVGEPGGRGKRGRGLQGRPGVARVRPWAAGARRRRRRSRRRAWARRRRARRRALEGQGRRP